jgi:hypothetical protein
MIRSLSHPMARLAVPVLIVGIAACGAAPESPSPGTSIEAAAGTITAEDMARKIGDLAHDSAAGRDTPSPELEKAAEYLVRELRSAGLEPAGDDGGYIQRFAYARTALSEEGTSVMVEGSEYAPTYGVDYFLIAPPDRREALTYYVGVAGEAGPPPPEARGKILVYQQPGTEPDQEWQGRLGAALQPAAMTGAPGVLVVLDPEFPADAVPAIASGTAAQQAPFAVAGLTHEAGTKLLAELGYDLADLGSAGEPTALGDRPVVMEGTRTSTEHTPPNVVAMLPGSDPELRDTYVVLTAHFDHVGVGQPDETGDSIFNGADDDASGTAAVLEVAEAFAALDQAPARSILFLLVSGEEKGLLGSKAWVESPTVDLAGVVANVNLDMVGRNAPDTLIGIGQEYTTLEGVIDGILVDRPELGLNVILDPVPEEMYFFRSDQLPFIQAGIPAVFFSTGDHEDYHEQSDEADRIDADKAARVARLSFYLAHAIATTAEPPRWTEEGRQRVEEMLQASPF